MSRLAVVLFNLGGPDLPAAVRPFLYNLFADPAILRLPAPFRQLLAWIIARRRTSFAQAIYAKIGGFSPILPQTEAQADALEEKLGDGTRVFVAMRYWHPFTEEAVKDVVAWMPERILLLPLYPQFSTTTTASSFKAWHEAARAAGLAVPTQAVCCYPSENGFVTAQAELLHAALDKAPADTRVLFSAHGLPERIVASGDPYPHLLEITARAIVENLRRRDPTHGNLDWRISYQSRVGRLQWIGPATDAEIVRAGREKKNLIVVPLAFVSEHSETLVELDIEYADLAKHSGVAHYVRVPTVSTHPAFIAGLADLVRATLADGAGLRSQSGYRMCPGACSGCPNREAA